MVMIRDFLLLLFILTLAGFIQTSGEDNINCVEIYNQPAFRHDLLKTHKIQERPSDIPRPIQVKKNNKWQTWEAHVSTATCPKGTVPIRDESYSPTTSAGESSPHEHTVGITRALPKMYGTKAIMSVWRPVVEKKDEFSLSQIWITSGNYETNDLNSIEVGWQVLPNMYKDSKPRLFIYWTSDTYNITGCYNLECPGFIQTSSSIVIGGSITPISVYEGNQYEITFSVWKDQKSGNWWLSLGSNHTLVGYWPAELFSDLAYARVVQWGGEIVNSHSSGRHTTTEMGSGHFPDEGFGKVSYVRNLEIVDHNNSFQPVQDVEVRATDTKFYGIKNMSRDDWGTYIFYGGPEFSGVSSLALSFFFCYFRFIIFFII